MWILQTIIPYIKRYVESIVCPVLFYYINLIKMKIGRRRCDQCVVHVLHGITYAYHDTLLLHQLEFLYATVWCAVNRCLLRNKIKLLFLPLEGSRKWHIFPTTQDIFFLRRLHISIENDCDNLFSVRHKRVHNNGIVL